MQSWDWTWDDAHVCAFDFETSGTQPEYALQPWRITSGNSWATSLAWVWPFGGKLHHGGGLEPTPAMMEQFIHRAISADCRVCGWKVPFDIAIMIAYGIPIELIRRVKWLDGLLLWRHLEIEPEYDDQGPTRSYSLKTYVREKFPEFAGYEAEIDFHDPDPAARAKLHAYNVQDCAFTLKGCKQLWHALTPRQRRAALIEADALPMVAEANVRGLLIDTMLANDVMLRQADIAAAKLKSLGPFILGGAAAASVKPKRKKDVLTDQDIVEQVIRSPQKLATLMFDDWGLTSLKTTDAGARSTDKEVLHELGLIDGRASEIKAYREALGNSTKFAETPIGAARYNGDGRAYPEGIVFGTYTGRMTYSSKQTKRNQVDE